ncbi:hypothetical protein [Pengzhenrongella phosphoraccumulans]|uniref:hypothetical protein n=1 Tax=Pengzhenrongella phosphoraccumulans TaxID=3114394 RepID=UPI00388CF769
MTSQLKGVWRADVMGGRWLGLYVAQETAVGSGPFGGADRCDLDGEVQGFVHARVRSSRMLTSRKAFGGRIPASPARSAMDSSRAVSSRRAEMSQGAFEVGV